MHSKLYDGHDRRLGDRRRIAASSAPFTALGSTERRQQGRRISDRTRATPREQLLDIARTFLLEEETP
ncbi:MAG TPA: hypothetical protein VFE36_12675 [Candidatus Baltobacteraceae bacterium]|jgi:hypothetical protein|nr:hypothetical protein [Candidatus Baltobacteraceae bacterium]